MQIFPEQVVQIFKKMDTSPSCNIQVPLLGGGGGALSGFGFMNSHPCITVSVSMKNQVNRTVKTLKQQGAEMG